MRLPKVTARRNLPPRLIQGGSPRLYYGAGSVQAFPEALETLGVTGAVLLITGTSAWRSHGFGPALRSLLEKAARSVVTFEVHGEPSPQVVDEAVRFARNELSGDPSAVVAVGGGSVIDAGKAASAAFCEEGSIKEYLEGVGSRSPGGARLPLIAASTTAGTGSEGTKNAVLSEVGAGGYKKSLRHESYVPDVAILDPELHLTAPRQVSAASGLDAITQLLEAYVSVAATPFTDIYCEFGLTEAAWAFSRVLEAPEDLEARGAMAMAAYLSGLSLASANLGLVHGAASPLGSAHEIPHGVVCGTLLAEVTARSVAYLFDEAGEGLTLAPGAQKERARSKYANAGRILNGESKLSESEAAEALVRRLRDFEELSAIDRLGSYGFTEEELEGLAPACGDKNQPVSFDQGATAELLKARL